MKKETLLFLGSLLGVFMLSGCTVAGKPDGGVYKSTDAGKIYEQKVALEGGKNIGNTNVLSLEFDPTNPDTLYLGTVESGLLRSTNAGDSWVRDVSGLSQVNSIVIDPTAPQTIYVAASKGGRGKILKTTNGGNNWDEIFTERTDGPLVLSLGLDSANPSVLYAGDSLGGIYKTENGGGSWKNLFWARSAVRDIAMDTVNANVIYFGTTNTGALVSKDAGTSFSEIVSDGFIYNVEVHPNKEGVVFLSDKNGLQISDNFGETWRVMQTLIKPEQVVSRGFAVNPKDDKVMYFASGRAFYKTTDSGTTWSPIQFSISRSIELVRINPQNPDILYVGANTRSSGTSLFPF